MGWLIFLVYILSLFSHFSSVCLISDRYRKTGTLSPLRSPVRSTFIDRVPDKNLLTIMDGKENTKSR